MIDDVIMGNGFFFSRHIFEVYYYFWEEYSDCVNGNCANKNRTVWTKQMVKLNFNMSGLGFFLIDLFIIHFLVLL